MLINAIILFSVLSIHLSNSSNYNDFLPNTNNFSIMERCQNLLGYWFDNRAINWDLYGLACIFRYNDYICHIILWNIPCYSNI